MAWYRSLADPNLVQSCCRSLIVDTLPISQQQLGSAWGKLDDGVSYDNACVVLHRPTTNSSELTNS
jgi:hypothetical protein